MTTLLETIGPAVWRASWQAAALALVIVLLLKCFGERLAPRWRYLLWSVVVVRLLFVATPGSPWSVFNLVRWNSQASEGQIVTREADANNSHGPQGGDPTIRHTKSQDETDLGSPLVTNSEPISSAGQISAPSVLPPDVPESTAALAPSLSSVSHFLFLMRMRILSSVWLAGCLILGLKLLATLFVLRRRLAVCRPVTDAAVLTLLEIASLRIGIKRTPALLVTPESISPCIVGTWNPRIVLPESIMTESSAPALRHVLAHELAHLVRGDLWTNWLLLAARILHWFNPVAWWTVREMQAEREAACDELALAALGQADRSAYAATIVDLAATLIPSAIAPGMIGLFSSTRRLKARVERLVRSPSVKTLRSPFAAALLLVIALMGLTDAMPGARAQAPKAAASTKKGEPKANTHSISGFCFNHADRSTLAGITVRLYRAEGRTSPPAEIAKTVTDADGRYAFTGLEPPRPEGHLDRLTYAVLGFSHDRPIGITFHSFQKDKEVFELRMALEKSTLSGRVVDTDGRPVAGATVMRYWIDQRPIPGLLSATTDVEGRFKIDNLAVYKLPDGTAWAISFAVLHPDHPQASGNASELPAEVVVTLPDGCVVTGTAADGVTGEPAAGAMITARRVDEWGEAFAATDAAGRFRLVVPEGRYDFLAEAKERVCIAVTDRECLAGEKVELPAFKLIGGGFISGQVVNTVTGQSVWVSEDGKQPIMLGLYGPSQPARRVISPVRLAAVDKSGRFILRAAPGENFPYFVNTRGVRMAWDTRQQPPVVVKDGETTTYNMLITPEVRPEEKLRAARKLVDSLSKKPSERTAQLLLECRKFDRNEFDTELWCVLMRELVAVGRDAVPQLSQELDQTTENRMLRRLGFALRAIGDPRAVPALIRAIPKTLLPSSSDCGLIVEDKELMEFMQTHHLSHEKGMYFNMGRPEREICGTLYTLTKKIFNDVEIYGLSRSEDPRRQVLQRRVFVRHAKEWQTWWEAHCRELTDDAAYQKVNLIIVDEPLPPASKTLGPTARIAEHEGWTGAVLSPAIQQGPHAWHFYDLDTGNQPTWPAHIPKDEPKIDRKKLADWAAESGVDLMCITHRAEDGTETFVLRTLGVKAWEIGPRELRNLDKLIAAGTLPEGREVGELLMHYDAELEQLVPDANGAFIFVTREGSLGLIETTGRVTRTANPGGGAGGPPPAAEVPQGAVGFHLGVRFNLKTIIP